MSKKPLKLILIISLIGMIATFFAFDLGRFLSLEYAKTQQEAFKAFYAEHPAQTIGIYLATYVLVTAASLPGAAILTLLGGAIFGLGLGTLLVSFASSTGATLAFLLARMFLRDYVQSQFKQRMQAINEGMKRDGASYLLTLRLVPAIPFFVINLCMGLTPISALRFFVISQIGMLPGTFVYVNAGTQLSQIESLRGILSPELLFSFVLLGVFPIVVKKVVSMMKGNKVLRRYKKPKSCDYNLVVIGAGSAGLVSAYIAATVKARVALIEKHKMGGDCLNTGCVPSKALISAAKLIATARRADAFGLKPCEIAFDFAAVMERIQRVIQTIEPHDSVERYEGLGVECIEGHAKIHSPYEVEVDGRTLTTRSIIIATGARPFVPKIPGLDKITYYTSDTIWNIRQLPRRLLVLGGGPIGCELAQSFQRFGSAVKIVEMGERLLAREDKEVSDAVLHGLEKDGVQVFTGHRALEIVKEGEQEVLICEVAGQRVKLEFDLLLLAIGRKPNIEGFGCEELGIEIDSKGRIAADGFLRTNVPNIFVCGDITGDYQFTHVAAHEAWYASVNALFAPFKSFAADYRVIPAVTFSDPEVARVGLSEGLAQQQGIPFERTVYPIEDLDRAIADENAKGFVKVLTVPGKDTILGVTIVGAQAGELLAEFVTAMKHNLGLSKILSTIHSYPTMSEANKYVAGEWRRAHAPQGALALLERFHSWRRGAGWTPKPVIEPKRKAAVSPKKGGH